MVGLETRLRTPRVTVFLGAAVFLVAAVGWMSPSCATGSSLADSALDPQAEGAIELREGVAIASTHESPDRGQHRSHHRPGHRGKLVDAAIG